uniref:Protein kinase domain-containing protein n=1 Tax=Megaselia scalaris TaxID=36166 RepID=T1H5A3_MEGSC
MMIHVYNKAESNEKFPLDKKCILEKEYNASNHGKVLGPIASGTYRVSVTVKLLFGVSTTKAEALITIPEKMSWGLIVGIIVASIFLISFFIILILFWRNNWRALPNNIEKVYATINPVYHEVNYHPDEWEIDRERVLKLHHLGHGSFGEVYQGIIQGINGEPDQPCAIKTVNENSTESERMNFLKEASVMKKFNTYHVIKLLGVVSIGAPPVYVVMELMEHGDLKSYLRLNRPVRPTDPDYDDDEAENLSRNNKAYEISNRFYQ